MKTSTLLWLALASAALPLACTHESGSVANHPESGSPSSGVPEGDDTSASPNGDVDNSAKTPTPPGTPPEDQRIPEGIAPAK